jgi:hypothetical protein
MTQIEGFIENIARLFEEFDFTEAMNWTAQYCYTTSNIYSGQRSEVKQHKKYKEKLLNKCYKSNRFIESLEDIPTKSLPHEMAEDHLFLSNPGNSRQQLCPE